MLECVQNLPQNHKETVHVSHWLHWLNQVQDQLPSLCRSTCRIHGAGYPNWYHGHELTPSLRFIPRQGNSQQGCHWYGQSNGIRYVVPAFAAKLRSVRGCIRSPRFDDTFLSCPTLVRASTRRAAYATSPHMLLQDAAAVESHRNRRNRRNV